MMPAYDNPPTVMLRRYLLSGDVTTVPSMLPPPIVPMIGREAEIQLLHRRLLAGPHLVFLTGSGGIGKSALALTVAHKMAGVGYFGDGVLWVDGREVLSFGGVLDEIARQLGQRTLLGRSLDERQRHLLQQISVHDYLLVIDDLDAIAEGRRATVNFLRQLPGAVLVTTRLHPPGLDVPVRIDPLSLEASHQLLQRLSGLEFPFDEAVGLLRQLEGSPLAQHLVAARLADAGTPLKIEEEMRYVRTGELLVGELQGETSSTLRALVLALRGTSPRQRDMLLAASCMRRSFTAPLLAHVLEIQQATEIMREMDGLHRRGLVEQTIRGWRLHGSLLEPLEQLIAPEDVVTWHRRAAQVRQRGSLEDRLMASEHLRRAGDAERAAELLLTRADELIEAGLESQLAEQLDSFFPQLLSRELWMDLNEVQGDVAARMSRWWEASHYYERALMQLKDTKLTESRRRRAIRLSRKRAAAALHDPFSLGERSALAEAELWLDRAFRLAPEEEVTERIELELLRSRLHETRGQWDETLAAAERALDLAEEGSHEAHLVRAHRRLGQLYHREGRQPTALAAFEAALELVGRDQRRLRAELLSEIARIQLALGNWVEALEAFEESLPIWRQISLGHSLARTLYELAILRMRQGRYDEAQRHLQECQVIAQRAVDLGLAISARAALAEVLLLQGDHQVAAAMLQDSWRDAQRHMVNEPLPILLRLRAQAAMRSGEDEAAARLRRRAEVWARRNQDRVEEGRARADQALAAADENQITALIDELDWRMIYERARLQLALAERLVEREPSRARVLIIQASDILARLGARPLLEKATVLRKRLGM